jgi:transcriptional regulator with XRE-family HTH domain
MSDVEKSGFETLGNRIRRLRAEKGMGQDRLAIMAHVDQSGLSKFERGSRGLGETAIRRIAGVLGVPYRDLIADTEIQELRAKLKDK